MKHLINFFVMVALVCLCGSVVWAAQNDAETSMIEKGKLNVDWMQKAAEKLEEALTQARREQNHKKVNCIQDRLDNLKELMTESQGMYQKLRALSLQQRVNEARRVFALLERNRRLALRLVELVDNCLQSINEPGGFVETLQEWLGDPENEQPGEEPGNEHEVPGQPEPLPSEFTPGPISEEQ